MNRAGDLLEWAEVTAISMARRASRSSARSRRGNDVLFDIDWQGTQQFAKVRDDLVTVFVLPPSSPSSSGGSSGAREDSDDTIRGRMAKAAEEISHYGDYDYIVINHDLEQAFGDVRAILAAERLRLARQTGLSEFVLSLRSDA